MMSVESELRKIIADKGYITVDEMMRISMSDLESSYYRSRQPLGENADFITAPEISQMFGEMIGIWALCAWDQLGRPVNVNLIEFGPGRGLLMRDVLRATAHIQDFHGALNISLCEINPVLMEEQSRNLQRHNVGISYISKISDIANNFPSIIIANEFFDALPIKQYIKLKNKWHERVIDLDKNGTFKWNHINSPNLFEDHINAQEGAILEQSLASQLVTSEISRHLENNKGAALIIDYGYNLRPNIRALDQYNSTLGAIKSHKFHNIFEDIGSADLSVHVDFDALQNIITSSYTLNSYLINQKELLKSLGIDVRLNSLIQKNPDLAQILTNQYNRLIADDQMGLLFKVLILESF